MVKLIAYRVAQSVVSLLIITMLTFGLLASAGGDAVSSLRDNPQVSEATINQLRRVYGLDKPVTERYLAWLTDAARGNLGESFFYRAPVSSLLIPRLLNTLLLSAVALIISWAVALGIGAAAARKPNSWIDRLCEALILLSASTPRIVLSLLALAWFSKSLLLSPGTSQPIGASSIWHLMIPAIVLAFPLIALFMAQVRGGLGEALREDFVLVARAKGVGEREIVFRHALRVALGPLLTIFGYSFGGLMSGSIIVEAILGWNGLGVLSVSAVRSRDVPLLMGVLLVTSVAVFVGNILADILLHLNDPRLRAGMSRDKITT